MKIPERLIFYAPMLYNYPIEQLHVHHRSWRLTPPQALTHFHEIAKRYNEAMERVIKDKFTMPRKKSNASQFSTKFASINLTASEKKSAKAWIEANVADFDTYWVNLGVDGWKQSTSYDSENDCWIGSLTQKDEGHINYDICVTSRAGNPVEATMLCFYKILELFPNKKIPTERESENWG